jgi:hypothetical protein
MEDQDVIRIYTQIPFTIKEGRIIYLKDSFDIYFGNNKTMYKFSNYIISEDTLIKIDSWQTYHSYLLFNNKDSVGRYFAKGNIKDFTYVKIDSILKAKAFKNMEIFDSSYFSLVKKTFDKKSNTTRFLYAKRSGLDYKLPDTIECHLMKWEKNIPFSFSPKLENKYKLKNIYTRLGFKSSNSSFENESVLPQYEIIFRLKLIQPVWSEIMSIN